MLTIDHLEHLVKVFFIIVYQINIVLEGVCQRLSYLLPFLVVDLILFIHHIPDPRVTITGDVCYDIVYEFLTFELLRCFLKEVFVFACFIRQFRCFYFAIIFKEVITLTAEVLFDCEVCAVCVKSIHRKNQIGNLADFSR